jgi:hypothetical protein
MVLFAPSKRVAIVKDTDSVSEIDAVLARIFRSLCLVPLAAHLSLVYVQSVYVAKTEITRPSPRALLQAVAAWQARATVMVLVTHWCSRGPEPAPPSARRLLYVIARCGVRSRRQSSL